MRKLGFVAVILLIVGTSSLVLACRVRAEIVLNDVSQADAVLVGRIINYRIIRDEAFRQRMLSSPDPSPALREIYKGGGALLSDYARFDIEVAEVLAVTVPSLLSVTWDNSTFGESEHMSAGPFHIALRDPSSAAPPLRGGGERYNPRKRRTCIAHHSSSALRKPVPF